MPPMLKADKTIGTQYLAMLGQEPDGAASAGGNKVIGSLKVSDYFEDPEGVANLIFSLAKLSDDDAKIVKVILSDMGPTLDTTDPNTFATDGEPTNMASVTGTAHLTIQALKAGMVTLNLMVKDGLPDGETTQPISVMVAESNAGPVAQAAVLTDDAYAAMTRTGVKRLASMEVVTVDVPDGVFFDADGNETLTITAAVGGDDDDAKAANAKILGVSIDANGDLVLTAKKGGPATGTIPVILTATDPYGKTAMTGNTGASSIQVKVNTPPALKAYVAADTDIPDGKKAGDKRALEDISDKDFTVTDAPADGADFITLATWFEDPDDEDTFAGAAGICDFATAPADQKYATVAFKTGREIITVKALKPGSFDIIVTCTDGKDESVSDQVTVTIRN